MTHANFDLLITRDGETYHVRVVESPTGSATAPFIRPFSDLEVENLLLRVAQPRGIRRVRTPQQALATSFGQRLFDAVFVGAVRDCFRASLAQSGEAGLRIRLRLTDVPEIASWPWEFLYDSTLNRFLALSAQTPIVRYLDLPEAPDPTPPAPPQLKILLMVASPTDYERLDVELEVRKVTDALADLIAAGAVVVDRVDVATLGRLQDKLGQGTYHIFHFIGHGMLSPETQEGVLMFEDDKERGRPVPATTLGTLLHDHTSLRVAVLNACEGGRTAEDDAFSGTAQTLLQQGIPAVVAMQSPISDRAAISFSQRFYSAIRNDKPLDFALAETRKAISADDELEWATPVLYLRSSDARMFSTPFAQPDQPKIPDPPNRPDLPRLEVPSGRLHRVREAVGLNQVAGPSNTVWRTLTFTLLLVAIALSAYGAYLRWFNLLTLETASSVLPWAGLVTGSAAALITAYGYLALGDAAVTAPKVARWVSLTRSGAPSVTRLASYAFVAMVAAAWIDSLPLRVNVVTHTGRVPNEAGWRWVRQAVEDQEETVSHEVTWHVGAGNRLEDLQLELRVLPVDAVTFGCTQVLAGLADDTDPPNLNNPESPLVIRHLAATTPDQPGRVRFTIARYATVDTKPSEVTIDVQLIRKKDGNPVAPAVPHQPPFVLKAQWPDDGVRLPHPDCTLRQ
ncbi:MAG TPA: CHAT domain-containing protein [Vicinamibacterales bacterium]